MAIEKKIQQETQTKCRQTLYTNYSNLDLERARYIISAEKKLKKGEGLPMLPLSKIAKRRKLRKFSSIFSRHVRSLNYLRISEFFPHHFRVK